MTGATTPAAGAHNLVFGIAEAVVQVHEIYGRVHVLQNKIGSALPVLNCAILNKDQYGRSDATGSAVADTPHYLRGCS
jgi:hypothetical protein